jgi:hypothetical protein
MAAKGLGPDHFPAAGSFKALGRAPIGFHFRHAQSPANFLSIKDNTPLSTLNACFLRVYLGTI